MAANPPAPRADQKASWPIRWIPGDDPNEPPLDGAALCLSGGGYRAMLFHVGVIWRLNELGYLDRSKLKRVSSVSGGSITAGVLAMQWKALDLETNPQAPPVKFRSLFVDKVRDLAQRTVDLPAAIAGLADLGLHGSHLANFYGQTYGQTKLSDLSDSGPLFIFNSTSLQTGELMRFCKPYMADWRIGKISNPDRLLAEAVAASSSWPPVLSPTKLRVDPADWDEAGRGVLFTAPYNSELVLTDGGVYDNLGLETAFKRYKTVLVSDAGGLTGEESHPHFDWPLQTYRVLMLLLQQVGSLRKRQLVNSFQRGDREGTYWSMGSDATHYSAAPILDCPSEATLELARIPTRLEAMADEVQERIINWGYAICDLAMRSWVVKDAPAPVFPYTRGVAR
jgi:NTE family protein